eukprot:2884373-Pleurochrysis_carterae.AAC.1
MHSREAATGVSGAAATAPAALFAAVTASAAAVHSAHIAVAFGDSSDVLVVSSKVAGADGPATFARAFTLAHAGASLCRVEHSSVCATAAVSAFLAVATPLTGPVTAPAVAIARRRPVGVPVAANSAQSRTDRPSGSTAARSHLNSRRITCRNIGIIGPA